MKRRWVRRLIRRLEPWYDWGHFYWDRLDDRGHGCGNRLEFEWLGIKLFIAVGRRPRPIR